MIIPDDAVKDMPADQPGPMSLEDTALRERSGAVTSADPLVSFLYELMRDHVPVGYVEEVLRNSPATPTKFSIGWLASYAIDVAARLREAPVDQQPLTAAPGQTAAVADIVSSSGEVVGSISMTLKPAADVRYYCRNCRRVYESAQYFASRCPHCKFSPAGGEDEPIWVRLETEVPADVFGPVMSELVRIVGFECRDTVHVTWGSEDSFWKLDLSIGGRSTVVTVRDQDWFKLLAKLRDAWAVLLRHRSAGLADIFSQSSPGLNYLLKVLEMSQPGGDKIYDQTTGREIICADEPYKAALMLLARLYVEARDEFYRQRKEEKASEWRPIHEWQDEPPHSSKPNPVVLVTSPALMYIAPVCFGRRALQEEPNGRSRWRVQINGRWVVHEPSHFRFLPPTPSGLEPAAYYVVQREVEQLRRDAGLSIPEDRQQ